MELVSSETFGQKVAGFVRNRPLGFISAPPFSHETSDRFREKASPPLERLY
jgi:hypothetical protein